MDFQHNHRKNEMNSEKIINQLDNSTIFITKNDSIEVSFSALKIIELEGKIIDLTGSEYNLKDRLIKLFQNEKIHTAGSGGCWATRTIGFFNCIKNDLNKVENLDADKFINFLDLENIEEVAITKYLIDISEKFKSIDFKKCNINCILQDFSLDNKQLRTYLKHLPAYGIVENSTLEQNIRLHLNNLLLTLKSNEICECDLDTLKNKLDLSFNQVALSDYNHAKEIHGYVIMPLISLMRNIKK